MPYDEPMKVSRSSPSAGAQDVEVAGVFSEW
ncbi:hypothetical protein STAFG_0045 [Streptomyces afghaniensis 772]|uniref:Uncharacterized protein n=1 Tax=Streptomyces afghaniensis 772 TaxID=1283301 RepID=S4NWC5_9ACTN|nr:hypothetical protein STAFG_0045 [Streptomyces afghaniensis 772]